MEVVIAWRESARWPRRALGSQRYEFGLACRAQVDDRAQTAWSVCVNRNG